MEMVRRDVRGGTLNEPGRGAGRVRTEWTDRGWDGTERARWGQGQLIHPER